MLLYPIARLAMTSNKIVKRNNYYEKISSKETDFEDYSSIQDDIIIYKDNTILEEANNDGSKCYSLVYKLKIINNSDSIILLEVVAYPSEAIQENAEFSRYNIVATDYGRELLPNQGIILGGSYPLKNNISNNELIDIENSKEQIYLVIDINGSRKYISVSDDDIKSVNHKDEKLLNIIKDNIPTIKNQKSLFGGTAFHYENLSEVRKTLERVQKNLSDNEWVLMDSEHNKHIYKKVVDSKEILVSILTIETAETDFYDEGHYMIIKSE